MLVLEKQFSYDKQVYALLTWIRVHSTVWKISYARWNVLCYNACQSLLFLSWKNNYRVQESRDFYTRWNFSSRRLIDLLRFVSAMPVADWRESKIAERLDDQSNTSRTSNRQCFSTNSSWNIAVAGETGLYLTVNNDRLTYLTREGKLVMSSTRLPYFNALILFCMRPWKSFKSCPYFE